MPPWHADPAYGHFSNDRRLSEQEIGVLTAWADHGAKEGDLKDAPAPLTFATGWRIGKPDMIVEMPNAAHIPATGEIPYSWIVVPLNLTEDRWVDKIEVVPSERSVVHHVVLYEREKGSYFMKDAKPGEISSPRDASELRPRASSEITASGNSRPIRRERKSFRSMSLAANRTSHCPVRPAFSKPAPTL